MYYTEHIIQALNKVPRLWSLQTRVQHLGSVTLVKYQNFAKLFEKNYKLDNKKVSIHMYPSVPKGSVMFILLVLFDYTTCWAALRFSILGT